MSKTIDCTPTWSGIVNWYIAVLEDGNSEGRKIAKMELLRMAGAADNWSAHCKELSSRVIIVNGNKTTIGEFINANAAADVTPISDNDMDRIYDLRICEGFEIFGGAAGNTVITRIS